MRATRRAWIACALLIGFAPSCSEPYGETTTDRILQYESHSDVVARFELGGTVVEVHPPRTEEFLIAKRTTDAGSSVSLDLNLDAVPASEREFDSGVRIWLAGERVRVEDGQLWIGTRSHGDVEAGPVVIDSDGVHVGP